MAENDSNNPRVANPILGELLKKQSMVRAVRNSVGGDVRSAEDEVLRQIRQAARGERVTKSGEED